MTQSDALAACMKWSPACTVYAVNDHLAGGMQRTSTDQARTRDIFARLARLKASEPGNGGERRLAPWGFIATGAIFVGPETSDRGEAALQYRGLTSPRRSPVE